MKNNSNLPSIFIIEDELSMRQLLTYIFADHYYVEMAANGQQAQEVLAKHTFDIILQDMMLPDMRGIDLLKTIRQLCPNSIVIVITAVSTWKIAVEAMRLGAFNYVKKPFDNKNIRMAVLRALQYKKALESKQTSVGSTHNLIGNSLAIRQVQEIIRRVASTDVTVLIYGESGTGKELVARAIHMNSLRREKVFIPVNCGAISENLIESELFGHVKGAFTDAVNDKKGLFEIANNGTLFLDEIGEMTLQIQVKLLRILEESEFMPLGSNSSQQVDVRFITATNRNLEELVEKGKFREDLYYRLHVIPIHIPPLRERKEDIPLLTGHFLSLHAKRFNKFVHGFSDKVMNLFMEYEWPGNVRELSNLIQRSLLMCEGDIIEVVDLVNYLAYQSGKCSTYPELPDTGFDLEAKLEEFEKFYITQALHKTGGHLTHAAKLLKISFRSLRYKIKKYKITNS